jgi:hypothetical protein
MIDHEDDGMDLYMSPERPTIKPRFNDVARVVYRWNRDYGPLNALAMTSIQDDDGDERLMYPMPPPSNKRLDPVIYPEPWDNNPVPAEVLRLYPRSHHEDVVDKPQNEDDRPIINVLVDEEPRGNSPPWRHLPGGFYAWMQQPGRFTPEDDEGEENDPEHEGSVSSMDCLVTRAHRYIRDW